MGWDDFNPVNIVEDAVDALSDGIDYVGDFAQDFLHNPLDAIGGGLEDYIKLSFGVNLWKGMIPGVETPANSQVFRGREEMVRDSVAIKEIVYGRVKKAGPVAFFETSGNRDRYLHIVMILASHPCESVDEVWFDDTMVATGGAVGAQDTQAMTIQGDYTASDVLEVNVQLGKHTAQAGDITSIAPENWTTDHRLEGYCFLHVRLRYSKKLYRQGVPAISVVMKGKNDIYDPRDTTAKYTNNHALCCLDYLRLDTGVGIPDAEINMQTFIDGANFCDGNVDTYNTGPSEARYRCDGLIKVDGRPLDTMEELQKAGGAYVAPSQGIWSYHRAEYQIPVRTLTEEDLAGPLSFTPASAKSGRVNRIKGVIFDPGSSWTRSEYPVVEVAAYATVDAEELEQDLNFNFITSKYQAQRVARIAMERSRYGMNVAGVFNLGHMEIQAGDRVTLDFANAGINNVVFLVQDARVSLEGGVALTMRQDDAAIYVDDPNDRSQIVAPPALTLPDPEPVAATGLAITEELYSTNGGRDIKTRIIANWTDVDPDRQQSYDMQFKKTADSDWLPMFTGVEGSVGRYDDVEPDAYDFQIRAVNSIGWAGDWSATTAQTILGKTAVPPDPGAISNNNNLIEWVYNTPPLDLAGFELRYHIGANTDWPSATKAHEGLLSLNQFDARTLLTQATTILVKAVDTSGIYSTNAATILTDFIATGTTVNWPDVNGRPSDDSILNTNATPYTLVASANITVTGSRAERGGGSNGWSESVRSLESFTNGAYVSFKVPQNDKHVMFGLNSDPTTDDHYAGIDYTFYAQGDGTFDTRHSNTILAGGTYSAGDHFAIYYDGKRVKWLHNGIVIQELTSEAANQTLHIDSSFHTVGVIVEAIDFGPYSFTQSSDIDVLETQNAPADAGATAGADFDSNVVNIPDVINGTATTGLNALNSHLGYFDGSQWQSYFSNNGHMYLNGDANNFLSWNRVSMVVRGDIQATSISAGAIDGETIDGVNITGVTITGTSTVTGATMTGGKFQTASTGERAVIDSADNSLKFFDSSDVKFFDAGLTGADASGNEYALEIGHVSFNKRGLKIRTYDDLAMHIYSSTNIGAFLYSGSGDAIRLAGDLGSGLSPSCPGYGDDRHIIVCRIPKGTIVEKGTPVKATGVNYVLGGDAVLLEVDNACNDINRQIGVAASDPSSSPLNNDFALTDYSPFSTSWSSVSATHDLILVCTAGVISYLRVSNANGAINEGDYLRARTADPSVYNDCVYHGTGTPNKATVAKALQPYNSATVGVIAAMVMRC